jgi:hypothetical protein
MRVALFFLFGCAGWAQGWQNMEIIFMVGGLTTSSSSSTVSGTNYTISGTAGFVDQVSYGYQIASTTAGNFWLELPQTFTWSAAGTISGLTVTSLDKNAWYFTPGLRFKTRTYGRVSIYGAAGFGYGSLFSVQSVVNGSTGAVTATSTENFHPAGDFGGGIDVRLSRLLSIRAEGRDFVTGPNLGGVSGHNHPVFVAGFAFHL